MMNTTDMIYEIARRSQSSRNPLTRKQVAIVVDELIDLMAEELSSPNGEIRLKQIGIFRVKKAKMPNSGGLEMHNSKPPTLDATYLRLYFYPSTTIRRHLKKK